MDDLISRQDAIDAIEEMQIPIMRSTFPEEQFVFRGMSESLNAIKELPSAQPEKRTNKRTETHSCDYISRQQAIGIVNGYEDRMMRYIGTPDDSEKYAYARGLLLSIDRNIKALPSAQPERKTGHWIKISPAGIYECSECGKNVMTADIDVYDFCHGCGAKMEVET